MKLCKYPWFNCVKVYLQKINTKIVFLLLLSDARIQSTSNLSRLVGAIITEYHFLTIDYTQCVHRNVTGDINKIMQSRISGHSNAQGWLRETKGDVKLRRDLMFVHRRSRLSF